MAHAEIYRVDSFLVLKCVHPLPLQNPNFCLFWLFWCSGFTILPPHYRFKRAWLVADIFQIGEISWLAEVSVTENINGLLTMEYNTPWNHRVVCTCANSGYPFSPLTWPGCKAKTEGPKFVFYQQSFQSSLVNTCNNKLKALNFHIRLLFHSHSLSSIFWVICTDGLKILQFYCMSIFITSTGGWSDWSGRTNLLCEGNKPV